MKNYQSLIGKLAIAIAIIIAGILISNALDGAGENIGGMISNALTTLR